MSRLRLAAYLCTPYSSGSSSAPQVSLHCQDATVPSMPQCPGCRLPLYILMSSLLLKFSEDAWGSLDYYTVCIFPLLPNPVSSSWSDLVSLRSLDPLHLIGVTSHTPLLAGSAVLPVPDAALRPHFYLQLWSPHSSHPFSLSGSLCHLSSIIPASPLHSCYQPLFLVRGTGLLLLPLSPFLYSLHRAAQGKAGASAHL